MIPSIAPENIYWFPADELRMWKPRADMHRPVPYEKEAPHVVQHRKGWPKVLATARYEDMADWIAANCKGGVERFLQWHFFFEEQSEAEAFASAWGGAQ